MMLDTDKQFIWTSNKLEFAVYDSTLHIEKCEKKTDHISPAMQGYMQQKTVSSSSRWVIFRLK